MNIQNLLKHTELLVKTEKTFTFKIIKNLSEIDKHKLFVELGYNSLFSYCRDHLKYSDQEAMIRVNAVRLIKTNKLAETKLENNEISLTTASDLFVNIKKFNESNATKLTNDKKNSLIEEVSNQASRKAKKIIQQELKLVPAIKSEIKLKQATVERLEKLKEKLSIHDLDLLLNHLMDEKEDSLKQEKPVRAQLSPTVKKSRYIPLKTKRSLLKSANYQCEFINKDGHIKPYSWGGSNEKLNLKILCSTHNQYQGIRLLGVNPMTRYSSN